MIDNVREEKLEDFEINEKITEIENRNEDRTNSLNTAFVKKNLGIRLSGNEFSNKTLSELHIELEKIKTTFKTVNIESLPDKGKKLIDKFKDIKKVICEKNKENEFFENFKDLSIDTENQKKISDTIDIPKSLKLNTFNDIKASIPVDILNRIKRWDNYKPQNSRKYFEEIFEQNLQSIEKNSNFNLNFENVKTDLMEHQISAVKWMMNRELSNISGGILADEMGLGKTLSILALIVQDPSQSTLVISPLSVLHQWRNEIDKHTSGLSHYIFHGKSCAYLSEFNRAFLILTTYGTLLSSNFVAIEKREWTRIVLDEAHTIKSEKTATFKRIKQLKSKYRWGLTGTPIHNSLNDLHSLVKYLNFDPWRQKSFWNIHFEKNPHSRENLSKLLKLILLRRTKNNKNNKGEFIVQLPVKNEILHKISLNVTEKTIYDKINMKLKEEIQKFIKKSSENGEIGTRLYPKVLISLIRLQQASSHFFLLKNVIDNQEFKHSLNDIQEITLMFDKLLAKSDLNEFSNDFRSSKIRKLLEILENVKKSDKNVKFVVVSQWTSFLKIIEFHLVQNGYSCETLSGSVTLQNREILVDKFNKLEIPQILLLSLKAGGVGLNLTGANNLILMDQHWNPALELQACDRIHRVGQHRNVNIHKILVENSIEKYIFELKNKKVQMVSDIFESYQCSQKLTLNEMKNLLLLDLNNF